MDESQILPSAEAFDFAMGDVGFAGLGRGDLAVFGVAPQNWGDI